MSLSEIDILKKQAAIHAVNYIQSGMVVGLGTGSTVFFIFEEIGNRINSGTLEDIICIPSSNQTQDLVVDHAKLKACKQQTELQFHRQHRRPFAMLWTAPTTGIAMCHTAETSAGKPEFHQVFLGCLCADWRQYTYFI